jgi:hypothetical protein
MYRILHANSEVRARRKRLCHPAYRKPELLAVRPNEVWSWDITKLKGPAKWRYFYLYVIIDIFGRRVVGWCRADAESGARFKALFDDTIVKHNVPPGQLNPACRPRRADEGKSDRLPAGRSRRHQVAQPAARLERQPVLGEPFQDPQISTTIPKSLWLHRARQAILPRILRLVQPSTPPCRSWPDDARPSPLRPSRRNLRRPPEHPDRRLRCPPRALRQKAANPTRKADRRLDQPVARQNRSGLPITAERVHLLHPARSRPAAAGDHWPQRPAARTAAPHPRSEDPSCSSRHPAR